MKLKFLPLLAIGLLGTAAAHAQCSTNMVADPTGSGGGTAWTLSNNGGNGIQMITDNSTDCYVFSGVVDNMTQTIDLENTFSNGDLQTQPNITFSEQLKTYSGAPCGNANYSITVSVLDSSSAVLQSWTTGTQGTSSNSTWETIEHSFVSYGGTPRFVTVENDGTDCTGNTSASEGVEFTAITLTAVVPTSTTGNVVGDQPANTTKSYDDPSTCTQTGVVIATGGSSNLGSTTVVSTLDDSVQKFNGEPYVARHYEIEPTTQLAATITLFVDQADFDAYNLARGSFPELPTSGDISDPNLTNLSITAFHGTPTGGSYNPSNYSGTRELIPNSSITKAWNASANRWEFTFTISSFSGFFLGTGTTPLNIHMGELGLSTHNNHHSLSWKTYTEGSNDHFEIERSTDGSSFATIQRMEATGKAGTYAFTDANTPNGTSYYRVKMVDGMSNGETYSNVVIGHATVATADAFSVFPNPANGVLNIQVTAVQENAGTLSLTDAAGKEVKHAVVSGSTTQMDIHGVPGGLYFLNYRQDNATKTIKVIVQ